MLNEIMERKELRNRRLVDLFEEEVIKIGDEIPYRHSEKTYLSPKEKNGYCDQTFSTTTKGIEVKWQAIGVEQFSGERCLKLIAKDPVFELKIAGAKGYLYGVEELNKISQLFVAEKIAQGGRSITIEDVNQLLDVEVDKNERRVYQKGYSSDDINTRKSFLKLCRPIGKYYNPESFLEKKYATNEIVYTAYEYRKSSIKGKEKEKEIVFSQKYDYWLASRGVNMPFDDINATFCLASVTFYEVAWRYSVFSSFVGIGIGNEKYQSRFYMRPIIYLKSNVTSNTFLRDFHEREKEKIQKELKDKQQEIRKREKELQEIKKVEKELQERLKRISQMEQQE